MEKKKLSLKEIGYGKLGLLFIVGALLLVISLPQKSNGTFSDTVSENSYETELESRLKATLAHLEGAGNVDVMITVNTGSAYREEIVGVVVMADGAENIQVKTQIYEAVEALFEVPVHKIKVLKRVASNS